MGLCIALGPGLLAAHASATPLDLADPTPRPVAVRFEVSPEDEPGALDRRWSVPRAAYLEPVPEPYPDVRGELSSATGSPLATPRPASLVRIRIPAAEVEAQLRSTGTDAVAGSFSEFVWTLDPRSGHVLEAALTGRVRERLRLGPIETAARIEIRVEMGTDRPAGFEPGHGFFGIRTNRFCAPEREDGRCVGVEPVPFDPRRGYVNAVGSVRAASAFAELQAFSPLGEVQFLERSADRGLEEGGGTRTARSGTSHPDAICSEKCVRPGRADLGGES